MYVFGPRAREIFVAAFTIVARSWRPVAVVSLVMLFGQIAAWFFASAGMNQVFDGQFGEAIDRVGGLVSPTGGTFSEDDIDFFESIDYQLTSGAIVWFTAAALLWIAAYAVTQVAWFRVMTAGRNGLEASPAAALGEAVRRFPRLIGSVLVVLVPFLVVGALLIGLIVLEPLLTILVVVPLFLLGFVWLVFLSVTAATVSIAPRDTPVVSTVVGSIRRQPMHAAKCLIMTILPAMVVGFGGGVLGQVGLMFGVWGYLLMSTISGIFQAVAQTGGVTAMYISMDGVTDPELLPAD